MIANLKRLLASKNFFWLNAISIGGAIAGMGLSYLYKAYVPTRVLTLAEFGLMGVMVAVWNDLTVPVASLTAVVSREMAHRQKNPAQVRFLLLKYLRRVGWMSALVAGAGAAVAFAFGQPLLSLVLLGLPFWYVMGVAIAYFQSSERILEMSLAANGAIALRLLGLLAFIFLGWGLYGAVGALAASALAACAMTAGPLVLKKEKVEKVDLRIRYALFWLVGAQILMVLMTNLDLLLVSQKLSNEAAGIYNNAEITSKILFSLAAAIGLVLYPKITKMDGPLAVREGGKLLLLSGALLIPIVIGFELLAAPFFAFFFPKFGASVAPFQVLSLSMLALGWSVLLANYLWARHVEKPVLAAYAVAVAVQGGLLLWQLPAGGMMGAAWASVGAGAALLLMLGSVTLWQMKKEGKKTAAS
ncbi:MAG: oligosaccharide flippase family protein [Candidatus Micrarchaeota archaeon]|nr:oligosaccharide flippase family protein [Candidatus Micrarchaeota archaeon]